jgi:enoyl-CoA hydratase
MKYIRFERIDRHIAKLVVNRPEVRNALNWEAMDEFSQVIQAVGRDPDVRVLLISGAGGAFISGADLGLLNSLDTREEAERLSRIMGEALAELRALPLISIAVIDGPARGGGAETAVSCDLRFMSADATIAFVHTSLGLIPGWGGAHRLYGLVGYAKGLEYLASARVIGAEEALRVGLVNDIFAGSELQLQVLAFAERVASNDWEAVKTIKELYSRWSPEDAAEKRLLEREKFIYLWDREERRDIFKRLKIFKDKGDH